MRTIQAFKNVITSLFLQVVVAISGILIPQFFIAVYGSEVNGLVASISQFITYMGLVEAGIGAAGMVALFKPLSNKDKNCVNEIMAAAKGFYYKSGYIFVGLVILLIIVYPKIIQGEISDNSFIRIMIFVLSINGIVDYFFLGKYRVLLNADQKAYVISLAQIAGTIVVTIVSLIMIEEGFSAVSVKSIAAIVYILRSIIVAIYVKKKYKWIQFNVTPNYNAFGQRWSALVHQIVSMIVNNTDIVLLTVLLPSKALIEVSVYSVYNMVLYSLTNMLTSISNALGSGFGDVIAKKEKLILRNSFSSYEYMFFIIIFEVYSCMLVLLYPFMELYSGHFDDAALYLRWELVWLFTLSGLLQSLRLPGLTVICAAGHYRETKYRAIIEACINIILSIALIFRWGITGVLVGTCISYLYRTTDVIIYSAKKLLQIRLRKTIKRIIVNFLCSTVIVLIGINTITYDINSWLDWVESAFAFGICSSATLVLVNGLLEPKEFKKILDRIKLLAKK